MLLCPHGGILFQLSEFLSWVMSFGLRSRWDLGWVGPLTCAGKRDTVNLCMTISWNNLVYFLVCLFISIACEILNVTRENYIWKFSYPFKKISLKTLIHLKWIRWINKWWPNEYPNESNVWIYCHSVRTFVSWDECLMLTSTL